MSIINDPQLVSLSLHRNTKRTRDGIFAHACIENVRPSFDALGDIRASREKLDSIFHGGKLFSFVDKLRDLCYAIDYAEATNVETDGVDA